ncbi:MAG: hypothetical protein KKA84_02550 [Bacteroidetes bacterium]|nr:hypothetical protein [Bacteroidota bacterium]
MSFYPQPDNYRCGPFALKYALVMLGVFKHEDKIAKIAGSTWWDGTDELGLAKAAAIFKCKMNYFQSDNPSDALKLLNAWLKKGIPCVLSVNNWEHWITVVKYTRKSYIYLDSENNRVIGILTSSQLSKYWRYKDESEDKSISYDGYAIEPKFKTYTKASFSLEKARTLMYKKNDILASKWDQYFNDLITICKPRNKQTAKLITFPEFLRRNEATLVRKIANWHGTPKYTELKKILYNMKFVAEIYDLIIPLDEEKKALVDISALLMMYACGKYGMDPIY